MPVRRVPIEELAGLNRNAADGAAQVAPVEIRGFNLDRSGGYTAAWRQADSTLLTGVSGTVRAYDPYGNALLSGANVLLGGSVSDQSSGSIAGKGTYLIPRVGVLANPVIRSDDVYEAGGYFTDAFGDTGDLNRVTGLTTTASGSGSGVGDGTYRFLVLVEAPTVRGFVTYQTLTSEETASSNDAIDIELDDALPVGYAARCYWWLVAGGEPGFTQVGFREVSDGSLISFTFDDDTADPTSDAVLSFSQDLRRVEPHRQRIWGVPSSQAFTGPYVAGFTVEQRFTAEPSGGEFLLSTPDNPDALNGTNEMSVLAQFNEGLTWQSGSNTVLWSRSASNLSDGVNRFGYDVAVAPDGSVFVVLDRTAESPQPDEDSALVKLNADGVEQWDVKATHPWRMKRVDVDDDGDAYILLTDVNNGGNRIEKRSSSNGSEVWSVSGTGSRTGFDMAVRRDGSMVYFTVQDRDGESGALLRTDSSGPVVAASTGPSTGYIPWGVTVDPNNAVTVGWHSPSAGSASIVREAGGSWSQGVTPSSRQPTALEWSPTSDGDDGNLDVVVLYSDTDGESSDDNPRLARYSGTDGSFVAGSSVGELSFFEDHLATNIGASVWSMAVCPGGQVLLAGRLEDVNDLILFDVDLRILDSWRPGGSDEPTWAVGVNRRGEAAVGVANQNTDAGGTLLPGYVAGIHPTHSWAPVAHRGDQFEVGVVFAHRSVGSTTGESARPYVIMEGLERIVDGSLTNSAGQVVWDRGSLVTVLQSLRFEFGLDTTSSPLKWRTRNSAGSVAQSFSEDAGHWPDTTMPSSNADLELGGAYTLIGGTLRHDWLWTEVYDDDSQTTTLASAKAEDWSSGSTFTSSETSETWTINDDAGDIAGGVATFSSTLSPSTTLVYSDVGDVNSGSDENYVQLELLSSQRITALASTPAGLVAFCDNESFLVRGDPALSDFQVQRLSGTVGCDEGTQPGRLGNVVFMLWQGRLYSLSLGMGDVDFGSGLMDISSPVFDPDDPLVQVVGEPRSRQVIARTSGGVILRYAPERQAWFTDVFSGENVNLLIPSDGTSGTRYRIEDDLWLAVSGADAPNARWEQVDLGDKLLRKLWRRLYVYTNDSYAGTPTLEWSVGGRSGSITGLSEGTGQWSFTFPWGVVSPVAQSLNVVLKGASRGDALEQPLEVEVVDRYRRR